MSSKVEAAYFLVVGILLIAAGAWSYASASNMFSLDESFNPVECGSTTFPIDPSNTVITGTASAKAYYSGEKTLEDLASVNFDIIIANDPCRDGYATVIVSTDRGMSPPQNLSLDQLALLIANNKVGLDGAVVSGLGISSAQVVSEGPELRPGAVPGTLYYVISKTYYDTATGIMVKRESTWVKAAGMFSPDVVYTYQQATDLLRENPSGGTLVSYTKSVLSATAYSASAAIGIVAGIISILYAIRSLVEL